MTVEEFESKWAEMLLKHDLVDNEQFLEIYDLRECSVPFYLKDCFFPFLHTTTRSEGFNVVLKIYVHPHDSLLSFFKEYMKLQEKTDMSLGVRTRSSKYGVITPWGSKSWKLTQ
jgi:hypothetical protein